MNLYIQWNLVVKSKIHKYMVQLAIPVNLLEIKDLFSVPAKYILKDKELYM